MTSLLLLSGGVDSAAVAAAYKPSAALFVDYGQRPAAGERRAAREVSAHLGLQLHEAGIDLAAFGSGLLSPTGRNLSVASSPEWFPYRNQFLITVAAATALALGHDEVWIGLVAEDRQRHADGTGSFVRMIDELLALQEGAVRLLAPAHTIHTAALLDQADLPGWLLDRTISCHVSTVSCGECPGCLKRRMSRGPASMGRNVEPHRAEG